MDEGHLLNSTPLDSRLFSNLGYCRLMPWVDNWRRNRVCEGVLSKRDWTAVNQSWLGCPVDREFCLKACELIARNFSWSRPIFLPSDECFVLFRLWLRRVADNMELEFFIMELEQLLGNAVSWQMRPARLTLCEFVSQVAKTLPS
jgi:hypothetical protein